MHKSKKHIYQFLLIGLLLFLSGCGGSCNAPMECEAERSYGGIGGPVWGWVRRGRTCIRDCSTRLFSLGDVEGGTKYSDWITNNNTGEWTRTHVVENWEHYGINGSVLGDTLLGIELGFSYGVDAYGDSTTEMRILMMDLSENKIIRSFEDNYIPNYQWKYEFISSYGTGRWKFRYYGQDTVLFSFWSTIYYTDIDFIDSLNHSYRWVLDLNTGKTSELNLNQIFKRNYLWHGFGRERNTLLGGVFISDSARARIFFREGNVVDSLDISLIKPVGVYLEMSLKKSRFEYMSNERDIKCIDLDVPNRRTIGDWYGIQDTIPNRPQCGS